MIVALIAVILAAVAPVEASHLAEQPKKHKIVYHLNEPSVDKARFVLGNIQNHIDGVGGMKNIEAIELVVHGPALRNFIAKDMNPDIKRALEELKSEGVGFGACGNTMRAFSITLEQLPPGTRALPQGGVVRVMELQEQGYTYIRP
jgi:uncharacterized protein